jgi:hypothetical protein
MSAHYAVVFVECGGAFDAFSKIISATICAESAAKSFWL